MSRFKLKYNTGKYYITRTRFMCEITILPLISKSQIFISIIIIKSIMLKYHHKIIYKK